jgi:hypothetical protein
VYGQSKFNYFDTMMLIHLNMQYHLMCSVVSAQIVVLLMLGKVIGFWSLEYCERLAPFGLVDQAEIFLWGLGINMV